MKHIAAALLIAMSGKDVTESGIKEVLGSVGVTPNPSVVKLVVDACKGKKPDQLIQEGLGKLTQQVAVAAASTVKVEETKKKEEPKKKVEEPKEEEDFGFGGLF